MNAAPEKRRDGKVAGSTPEERSLRRYSGTIAIILVVFFAMTCLLAMILLEWNGLNQPSRVLPASLLAVSTADYSGVRPTGQVHVIEMGIIGDMLKDQGDVQPGDLTLRLASITALFLSPVPSATSSYPQNVAPSATPMPTRENPPEPRATSTAFYHPTASQVPPTSNPPLVSPTVPGTIPTSIVPVPTETPAPNPQPTSTSAPNPPTSQPPTSHPPTSQPPTSQPPTSQPPTSQPPTAKPPPPKSTPKPHPPHPTDKPHPPKPTKKPKK